MSPLHNDYDDNIADHIVVLNFAEIKMKSVITSLPSTVTCN